MTVRDDGTYAVPSQWSTDDSRNLTAVKAGVGAAVALLAVTVVLLVAGLILGIVAYTKVVDRLDNIENSAATVADRPVIERPVPAPAPDPKPTP